VLRNSDSGSSDRDVITPLYGSIPGPNLRVYQSPLIWSDAGASDPIMVNGVEGTVQVAEDDPTRTASIHWRQDGMTYSASSRFTENWTLDDFLALLDTIP